MLYFDIWSKMWGYSSQCDVTEDIMCVIRAREMGLKWSGSILLERFRFKY